MNILNHLTKSNKIALIQGKKKISFTDLLEQGLRFGTYLTHQGIKKDDAVLIFIPLSITLYKTMIGAWAIGAVPIFVDFSRGVHFVNDTVLRLKPKAVICDHITALARLKYPSLKKIKMLKIHARGVQAPILNLDDAHPALLTFTSGTTGTPKTVVRSHGFLMAQYEVLKEHLDFSSHHTDLGTLAVFTLANLASLMTTVLPTKRYQAKVIPKKLARSIEKESVSRLIGSPKLISDLLQYSKLKTVEVVYLGGAPVYPSVIKKIPEHIDLHLVYGSTEAEPIAHLKWSQIDEVALEKIRSGYGLPVGRVVPEVECMIGEDHEILVRGVTVLAKDGPGTWHKTGDTGFFDETGSLWLTGKVSQTINDKYGILHPFAIECVLDSHFGIRGAVLKEQQHRIVVIGECGLEEAQILAVLEGFHVDRVMKIEALPMDKRHGAKIDYERVKEMISK